MRVFGEHLRETRKASGKTIAECANIFGVTQPAWTFWEQGTREPKLDTLVAIADFFGTTPDELLGLPSRGTTVRADKGSMAVNISNNRLDGSIGPFSITSDPPPSCKKCPHLKKLKELQKLIAK